MLLSRFGSMSPIGGVYSSSTPAVTTNMINLLVPTVASSRVLYAGLAQDGTNIIASGTYQTSSLAVTAGLMVIDDNGDTTQNYFYTRPNYNTGVGGIQQVILANNGYWYGFTSSGQAHIIKFNNFGSIQSVKRVTMDRSVGVGSTSGYYGAIDSSNNFFLAGQVALPNTNRVIILVKLDNNMNVLWKKEYDTGTTVSPTLDTDIVWMVKTDSSGNAYIVGRNNQSMSSSTLMKVSSAGILQFAVGLDASGTDTVGYNDILIDGSDIYAGGSYTSSGVSYGLVAKYNTDGVLQWQKKVDNTGVWEIKKTDGRFFYSGTSNLSTAESRAGSTLGEMDSNGNTLWQTELLAYNNNLTTPVSLVGSNGLIAVDSELNTACYMNLTSAGVTTLFSVLLKVPDDGTIPGSGAYGFFGNQLILTYKPLTFTNANSNLTPINISYTQRTPIVSVYEDTSEWQVASSLVTNYKKYI